MVVFNKPKRVGKCNCSTQGITMTPSWVGVLICQRVGGLCRGLWTGWINRPRPEAWGSTRQSPCWVLSLGNSSPCSATSQGKSAWKTAHWKRSWGCWQQLNMSQCVPRWPRSFFLIKNLFWWSSFSCKKLHLSVHNTFCTALGSLHALHTFYTTELLPKLELPPLHSFQG